MTVGTRTHARAADGWRNWSGNVHDRVAPVTPHSVDELSALVRDAAGGGPRVRAGGSGHSFSSVAACDGVRVSLAGLPAAVTVDGTSVTVPGGLTLRKL